MPLFSKKYEGMNFSKFKYRQVVLGNKWKNDHGIDTFSDMIHMDTLKILLSMAASVDWEICKVDVAEAFLTTRVNKRYPPHMTIRPTLPQESSQGNGIPNSGKPNTRDLSPTL